MAEKIELDRRQIRTLLLYEFCLHHTAADAARNICDSIGEDTVSYDTAKNWFHKFKNGVFEIDDKEHPGRPSQLDDERLLELIKEEPRLSTRELGELLECDQKTVDRHLHQLGKVSKLGAWVPHQLSAAQGRNGKMADYSSEEMEVEIPKNKQQENVQDVRGKSKSGRWWKEAQKQRHTAIIRARSLKCNAKKNKQDRLRKQMVKDKEAEIREAFAAEKATRLQMQKEREERRKANEQKAEVVQVIRNPSKLAKYKKKKLRNVTTRDTN